MKPKYIYWFSYYNNSVPSVRYRGLMPLLHLSKTTTIQHRFVYPSYRLRPLFVFITTYFEALFFRKPDSLIVFQKIHSNGIYARLLKYLLKKQPQYTIYDIDDAEYTRRPVATMHHFMQHCNCCTVGSVALQQYAAAYNKNVFLLTSPVQLHTHFKQQRNVVFTIGWIGYFGAHNDSFEQYIYPIITSIPFPVRLMILGITNHVQLEKLLQQFQAYEHVEVVAPENIDWLNEDVIYNYIKSFDVGIAPLTNTEFNRAKSAYKMKQYLSCGVPVLASPVGENNTFLQDGVQGFMCKEAGDFLNYIIHIHNMKEEEYTAMCAAALQQVRYFSMQTYCDGLLSLVAQLNL